MKKTVLRGLLALSAVLVISCGGGSGSSDDGSATGASINTGVKNAGGAPEWGFAGTSGFYESGGGDAGPGSSGGSGTGASSGGNGGTSSASAGGDSGVGSGGTGASASAGDSGDSGVGGVGGVASIIVNGVRYDTTGAVLKLRDAPQLQLGMTAKVNGATNADFTAGMATEVESAADMRGTITSINASGVITMLGMNIETDSATVWGNVSGVSALSTGMMLQVWGLPAGPGILRATRIEQSSTASPILSGSVQSLDLANLRFVVGGLWIDATGVSMPAGIGQGVNVRVRAAAQPSAGTLKPSSVELWYPVSLRDGTRRQLGGVVTDFSGVSSFRVLGVPIDASSAQVSGGPTSAIVSGAELDVAGTVSNGILVATKIKIKKTPGGASPSASFTAIGTVGAFQSVADFKVKGQRIDASAVGVQFVNGNASTLHNGVKVSITGDRIVNDVLIATRVSFD